MGSRSFCVTGYGMTEAEARRNAEDSDRNERGEQEGYNGSLLSVKDGTLQVKMIKAPKKGKPRFEVEKHKEKTRKWTTRYVAYAQDENFKEFGIASAPTQTECVNKAKEVMDRRGLTQGYVMMEKFCESRNALCGRLSNPGTEAGIWHFMGEGRE